MICSAPRLKVPAEFVMKEIITLRSTPAPAIFKMWPSDGDTAKPGGSGLFSALARSATTGRFVPGSASGGGLVVAGAGDSSVNASGSASVALLVCAVVGSLTALCSQPPSSGTTATKAPAVHIRIIRVFIVQSR
jgi:hypothetical protein